jgi:predicted RNA binding protein YcfA (HicA-like mRNA interferase family)
MRSFPLEIASCLSGHDLAHNLRRYGYEVTRQTGSHLRLKSTFRGTDHFITIPAHLTLKLGTLNSIISSVATYLEVDRLRLLHELFGK